MGIHLLLIFFRYRSHNNSYKSRGNQNERAREYAQEEDVGKLEKK